MTLDKHPALALLSALVVAALTIGLSAQESKPTIRHHRVEEAVPDDSSSPEVEQAETAMQHGDLTSAESLLQKAVGAKPSDYRAWFDLGYVYNATHRQAEAIEAYEKSVAAKPDVFESNLNLGLLLARQGNDSLAVTYLKAATQLKPTTNPRAGLTRAWQTLGRVEEATEPQQALAAYSEAAKLSPQSAEPRLAAAGLLAKQKDLDAALREYQAAAELDPKSQDALTGMVNIYLGRKQYAEAETTLRKLLATDPQSSAAQLQLARVLSAQGKNAEAAQQLQSGTQAQSGDPRAALDLGTLYVKAGKDAEAEQQFRIAVQKLPRDAEAHFALGSVLMHQKKYVEAQTELIAAITLKADLAEAYGNLAVVAAENKNYPLTLKALDDRAKYLPEIPATYFLRATSFDNMKAKPQAVEYYQRFLAAYDGKSPDQQWQARHRLIALDPQHADKYRVKK